MDFSKLTTSDKVIAGSGIALFIFSFLPWYGLNFTFGSASRNGWSYFLFGTIPVLLGLVLVAYVAITRFSEGTKLPELPIPYGLAVLIVAGIAAALVILKLLIGDSVLTVHLSRKYGLFLSTLAAIGLVAGGFMKYQEEGGKAGAGPAAGPGTGPTTPF